MDERLLQALLNTALLVACSLGLWLYWRREARLHPEALAPLPPIPDASIIAADLVAERRKTQETLEQACKRMERVGRAFRTGGKDAGRHAGHRPEP